MDPVVAEWVDAVDRHLAARVVADLDPFERILVDAWDLEREGESHASCLGCRQLVLADPRGRLRGPAEGELSVVADARAYEQLIHDEPDAPSQWWATPGIHDCRADRSQRIRAREQWHAIHGDRFPLPSETEFEVVESDTPGVLPLGWMQDGRIIIRRRETA